LTFKTRLLLENNLLKNIIKKVIIF